MISAMYTPDTAIHAFHNFIRDQSFPCVAAKSALATDKMQFVVAGDLRDRRDDLSILAALRVALDASELNLQLASTVILFPLTPSLTEIAFERHLWALLESLYKADCEEFDWDSHVSSDPQSANFAISIGGTAVFVVGLHPGSSRLARRAPVAAVAFNPHSQFRHLKKQGLYARLRAVIRERDIHLQGDANPMLAEHGTVSEAAQYSGRQVFADWKCPFRPQLWHPT